MRQGPTARVRIREGARIRQVARIREVARIQEVARMPEVARIRAVRRILEAAGIREGAGNKPPRSINTYGPLGRGGNPVGKDKPHIGSVSLRQEEAKSCYCKYADT